MSVREYVGARYVPIISDPVEWDNKNEYEPLTIVIHEGNSYTSRQHVPIGIDISNNEFWVLTGNYNAQIEIYRKEVSGIKNELEGLDSKLIFSTPSEYGAVGDGVTDDTDAFIKMIAANVNIMLEDKTYLLSTMLTIDVSKIWIRGISGKSTLKFNNFNGTCVNFMSTAQFDSRNTVNNENGNFTILGGNNNIGVSVDSENGNVFNQIFRNIVIRDTDTGIMLGSNIYKNTFETIVVDRGQKWSLRNKDSIFGEGSWTNSGESNVFLNCAFYVGSLYINQEMEFIGCAIHYNDQNTISDVTASHFFFNKITFNNCHFETLFVENSHDIIFHNNGGFVTFDNCLMIVSPTQNLFIANVVFDSINKGLIIVTKCDLKNFTGRLDKNAKLVNGNVRLLNNAVIYRNFYAGGPSHNMGVIEENINTKFLIYNIDSDSPTCEYTFSDGVIKVTSVTNDTLIGVKIPVYNHSGIVITGSPAISGDGATDVSAPLNNSSSASCLIFLDASGKELPFDSDNDSLYLKNMSVENLYFNIPCNACYAVFGVFLQKQALPSATIDNVNIDVTSMSYGLV